MVLGGPTALPASISKMLRGDVLVLSQDKLDPQLATLPAVEGLQKKWARTEASLVPAVARLNTDDEQIQVSYTWQKQRSEERTRMVKAPDGQQMEQNYTVTVPYYETIVRFSSLPESEVQTLDGTPLTVAQKRDQLKEPQRVFFQSEITPYIASVRNPNTLLIRTKESVSNSPTPDNQ